MVSAVRDCDLCGSTGTCRLGASTDTAGAAGGKRLVYSGIYTTAFHFRVCFFGSHLISVASFVILLSMVKSQSVTPPANELGQAVHPEASMEDVAPPSANELGQAVHPEAPTSHRAIGTMSKRSSGSSRAMTTIGSRCMCPPRHCGSLSRTILVSTSPLSTSSTNAWHQQGC